MRKASGRWGSRLLEVNCSECEGVTNTAIVRKSGRLLLQHHLAVGVFESLQLRQERQAEQIFRQRFVRQHHGVDVAHHEPADINPRKTPAPRVYSGLSV